jgi:hypothetical protein
MIYRRCATQQGAAAAAEESRRADCGTQRVLGTRAHRQVADLGAGEGERRDEVDRGGHIARLLGGELPVAQGAAARAPATKIVRERREAPPSKRTRVDERHLFLDGLATSR